MSRRLLLISLLSAFAFAVPMAAIADTITSYTINFTANAPSPLSPTSGEFTYDADTETFSNFLVSGNGFTFDLTQSANDANTLVSGIPYPSCVSSADSSPAAVFAFLATGCGADPDFTPTYQVYGATNSTSLEFTLGLYQNPGSSTDQVIASTNTLTPLAQTCYTDPINIEVYCTGNNIDLGTWTTTPVTSATNVPEASSLIQLLAGLLALAYLARKPAAQELAGWRRI